MPMTKPTSEQVTFLAAGSGATQRTALDKLRDVVSVKDFGAVGDGVVNDGNAILARLRQVSLYTSQAAHISSVRSYLTLRLHPLLMVYFLFLATVQRQS